MKLAVIGAGKIGGTLGKALAASGHDVHYGTRTPEGSVREALDGADAVIIAIPGQSVADFVRDNADQLADKLVIDTANNLGGGPVNSSADFAAHAPTARYARAFSTLGWENFAEPVFGDVVADLFYSTSEADSETVAGIIADVGLNPVYLGPDQYDLLDQVLKLWFALAISQGRGRHLAFKVL
jgi:8-hydroxy-5-deazaflavin:NADPH oxidoreductase